MVTADQNIRYQQNLTQRRIALVVLGSNRWPYLRGHLPEIVAAVNDGATRQSMPSSKFHCRPSQNTADLLTTITKTCEPKQMPQATPILNAQNLAKSFGATTLFRGISFTVNEGDRIGLIGPNGSGKSTLLRILAGEVDADSGEVASRKRARLSYVTQDSQFEPGDSVREVILKALKRSGVPEAEWEGPAADTLGRAGFEEFDTEAVTFSGGWRKRLAIAEAWCRIPTCCCSTSRLITSIWLGLNGWSRCWQALRLHA